MLKQGIKLGPVKALKAPVPLAAKTEPEILGLTETDGLKSQKSIVHNIEVQLANGTGFAEFELKPFVFKDDNWLTVADGCGHLQYYSRKGEKKTAVKWGQLKLFTTELQFLNKYWDPSEIPNPLFVYAGAAPGNHIYFLARMFPAIKFYLYDSQPFDERLKLMSNVQVMQRYFEDVDIELFKDRPDVFFVSDIRSLTYSKIQGDEEIERKNEAAAAADMKLQMEWVKVIKPVKALLKFRLPYQYAWNKDTTFMYQDGDVYKQAWSTQTSTEGRLVPDLSLPEKPWNFVMYQDMLFYHNKIIREKISFINPLTGINESISSELGLLQDYDSTVFTVTVKEYLEKHNSYDGPESVLRLCKAIIDDIGKGTVNLVGLRSGMNSDAKLLAIQNALREMGEEAEE